MVFRLWMDRKRERRPLMRARNIKPGFFLNEHLAELDPLTRILFAGLWCMADREGRLEDRPKRIKATILPYDNCDVDAMLQELHDTPHGDGTEEGFIVRYEADGQRCIQIAQFLQHQQPHYKERSSGLPEREGVKTQGLAVDDSRTNPGLFGQESSLVEASAAPPSPIPLPSSYSPHPSLPQPGAPGGEGAGEPAAMGGEDVPAAGKTGGPSLPPICIKHDGVMTPITEVPGDRLAYLVNNGKTKALRMQCASELARREGLKATARSGTTSAPLPPPRTKETPEEYQARVNEIRRRNGWDQQAPEENHGYASLQTLIAGGGEE
jgi:hypothetical protein